MKKIVLFLSVLCLTVMASAQDHLKFKNIPIDGPKKAFIEQLEKNEFHLIDDNNFGASLRGRFTGRPVTAFVMTTTEGTVCRVAVNYDAPEHWMSLRLLRVTRRRTNQSRPYISRPSHRMASNAKKMVLHI